MFKSLLLAAAGTVIVSSPVWAQAWQDTAGATGDQKHQSQHTDTVNFYQPSSPEGSQGSRQVHFADSTHKGNVASLLTGSSMPIIGGFAAAGNLALQNEGKRSLPRTRLESFVFLSGYNDRIYGDEGRKGPPPYSSFSTIGSGGVSATTGHPSDAPSAWY